MKSIALAVVLLGIAFPRHALATNVSGTITTDTTWTLANSPYLVTGDLNVAGTSTPTLTIQPGVVVKVQSTHVFSVGYLNPGRLIAVGTSSQPILMTTDQGTVTAGYWRGLFFCSAGASLSQLAYLTIEGGGYNIYGQHSGLYISLGSLSVDHVTVRKSNWAAFTVAGGTPTVTNSAFTGTTGGDGVGVDLISPGALTISGTSITGNAGGAIAMRSGTALSNAANMTVSGNGTDAVLYRDSTIGKSQTWNSFGIPYIPDTEIYVSGTPTPVLTIEPGVTVKMRSGSNTFAVGYPNPGNLIAVGTPSQPILYTTLQSPATAGYWRGLFLVSSAVPSSQLAYVIVEGGGYSVYGQHSGLFISAGAPTLDNVTVRTSRWAALTVAGGTPVVTNSLFTGTTTGTGAGVEVIAGALTLAGTTTSSNAGPGIIVGSGAAASVAQSSFLGNVSGLTNQNTTGSVGADLNYWGASSGPNAGPGTGTGQSVSSRVTYEPWLSASPSTPQYIATFTQTNRTFNPNVGVNSVFNFTTSLAGNSTLQILTSTATVIRTFTGSGVSGTATWDGKNDGGTLQANGTYTYQLSSTTSGGQSATLAQGLAILDTTLQVGFTGLAVSQAFFSPNGDGVQDTTALTGTVTPSGATWTVNVQNSVNTIVRTYSGSAPTLSVTWDGKNSSGVVQPDGVYTFQAIATYGTAFDTSILETTLDDTPPTSALTAPTPSQFISNVYQNGATDFGVSGTASDTNITSWKLDYGAGSAPTSWTTLGTGTSGVSNGPLGTWSTVNLAIGSYAVRLRTWDKAGNLSTTTVPITAGNFKLTQNPQQQINAALGQTITYTSVVPVTLTETLTIRNEAGHAVRTLFNGSRPPGTYVDSWDGKGDSGQYLASGGYFAVASTLAGSSSMTWNQSNQYLSGGSTSPPLVQSGSLDLLNNQPLTVTYTLTKPSRVSMILRNGGGETADSCAPPQFCVFYNRYEEVGQHTEHWAGVDSIGAIWGTNNPTVLVVARGDLFPTNAVVVLGTRATLTNLIVTPPRVNSGNTLSVAFDLSTYQNVSSSLTVTFMNQSSLSILRTITLPAQVPGHVTVNWDTRADNGTLVAPGRYVITISGQDFIGNQVFGQSLATVEVLR